MEQNERFNYLYNIYSRVLKDLPESAWTTFFNSNSYEEFTYEVISEINKIIKCEEDEHVYYDDPDEMYEMNENYINTFVSKGITKIRNQFIKYNEDYSDDDEY